MSTLQTVIAGGAIFFLASFYVVLTIAQNIALKELVEPIPDDLSKDQVAEYLRSTQSGIRIFNNCQAGTMLVITIILVLLQNYYCNVIAMCTILFASVHFYLGKKLAPLRC